MTQPPAAAGAILCVVGARPNFMKIAPVIRAMKDSRVMLTVSGGIQEETTALGVPCITLRENTERPITAEEGTNTVVGQDPARILAVAEDVLRTGGKAGRIPELWDGHASQRIAEVLRTWLGGRAAEKRVA